MFSFFSNNKQPVANVDSAEAEFIEARKSFYETIKIRHKDDAFLKQQAKSILVDVDRIKMNPDLSIDELYLLIKSLQISKKLSDEPTDENIAELNNHAQEVEGKPSSCWKHLGRTMIVFGAAFLLAGTAMKIVGLISLLPSGLTTSLVILSGFLVAFSGYKMISYGREWCKDGSEPTGLSRSISSYANAPRPR